MLYLSYERGTLIRMAKNLPRLRKESVTLLKSLLKRPKQHGAMERERQNSLKIIQNNIQKNIFEIKKLFK
jgi:hypothetical protein